jgi:transposase
MQKPIPTIKEQIQELEQRLHKEKNPKRKIRLHMLVLLKSGKAKTRKEVAEHLAVHRNTIRLWLALYESGGISSLIDIKSKGPSPGQYSLPMEVVEELNKCLEKPKGFGSYGQIQAWIQKTYGLYVKYKTLYRIVHYELKAKPKVARKSHIKKRC